MIEDINYGRVFPIRNQMYYRRRGYPLLVDVKFWFHDSKPIYANGDYLYFEVEGLPYHIYNPQNLAFDVNKLISVIRTVFRKTGLEAESFTIVKESG